MQVNNLYGKLSGGGSKPPTIQPLNVSENGTYTVPEGVDGFSPVEVNVHATPTIEPLTIIENGTYTTPEGVDGFSPINVNVPIPTNIGQIIVDKFQYVVNGNKIDIPCTLKNQTCYAFIIYDDYLFTQNGFACGCFYKKESGSIVEQNYINYPNTMIRFYWSNTYFGLAQKFNGNTQNAYITIIEINKSISDDLIPN